MANAPLRSGHWYTTANVPHPAAHKDSLGRAVCVYFSDQRKTNRRDETNNLVLDEFGVPETEFVEWVAFQDAKGHDLAVSVFGQTVFVRKLPSEFTDLRPLLDPNELPVDRRPPPGVPMPE